MKKYLLPLYFNWLLPGLIYGLLMWLWQWRDENMSVTEALEWTLFWLLLTNILLAWNPIKRLTARFCRSSEQKK